MGRSRVLAALAMVAWGWAARADAATRAATLVVHQGSIPLGAPTTVADVFFPIVSGADDVALGGHLTGGEPYLLVRDQIAWLGSAGLPNVLTSLDPAIGVSDDGAFVVRVSIDGATGLWTAAGQLARAGDAAPGLPPGAEHSDFLRPSMDRFGTVYWRGLVDVDGNGFAEAAAFYRAADGDPMLVDRLWGSGDFVAGIQLDASTTAVDNDFAVSDDGMHVASVLVAEGSTSFDGLIVVDDVLVAREGSPAPGSLANWQNFDHIAVNDAGDVIFTGDDSGPANGDEFIAYNGAILLHEGDVVDGLTVSNAMRQIAVNDFGQVAFTWQSSDVVANQRLAFFACDAGDLAAQARLVLSVQDQIDIDGDGVGDLTVTEIRGLDTDPGKILGDELALYLEVDLDPGAFDAVIRLPVDCCDNGVNEGNEPCDDGNDDETDACLSTCVAASCGDGIVWAGVEECDDGNAIDDDACHDDCTLPAIDPTTGGSESSSGTSSEGTTSSSSETSESGTSSSSETSSGAASSSSTDDGGGTTSSGGEDTSTSTSTGESGDSTTTTDGTTSGDGTTGAESTTSAESTTGAESTTAGESTTAADVTTGSSSSSSAPGDTSSTSSGSSDTGTDTEGAAVAAGDGGCGCAADRERGGASVLVVLLLGLRRRARSR